MSGGGFFGNSGDGQARRSAWLTALVAVACLAAPATGWATTSATGAGSASYRVPPGPLMGTGFDDQGELGSGDTLTRSTPVGAAKGLSNVVAAATGTTHSVALLADGTVRAWGDNSYGQLGNGTAASSTTPVAVSGLSNVVAVAAGDHHTLALLADGTVRAWGDNSVGQLGDALAEASSSTPVVVPGLSNVVAIAAGQAHNLALLADGTVRAWGANDFGEVGNGSTGVAVTSPVVVSGLSSVVAVAAGAVDGVALLADGSVRTWGENSSGQLGNGSTTGSTTPVAVSGLSNAVAVAAGSRHVVALLADGTVRSWGLNADGQLGNGVTANSSTPVQVSGLSNAVAIATGGFDSVALLSNGGVQAWGRNASGQLGNGSTTSSSTPVAMTLPGRATALATGARPNHTLVVMAQASLSKSVTSLSFPLQQTQTTSIGRSVTITSTGATPLQISAVRIGGTDADQYKVAGETCTAAPLATGKTCTVSVKFAPTVGQSSTATLQIVSNAVSSPDTVSISGVAMAPTPPPASAVASGPLFATGYGLDGELGNGGVDNSLAFAPVPGLPGAVGGAAGGDFSLALAADGTVWATGNANVGQLGNGSTQRRLVMGQVPALSGVVQVAAGWEQAMALRSDGTVWTWGDNSVGQRGIGSTAAYGSTPVQVGLSQVVAIAAGSMTDYALRADGTVWSWGDNSVGELGNGSTATFSNVPVQVSGLTGVRAIAAGDVHALALLTSGGIKAWGDGPDGELGNNTTGRATTPVNVLGIAAVTAIAAGAHHSLAIAGTAVYGWGLDNYGQLGDGSTGQRLTPFPATGVSGATAIAAASWSSYAVLPDGRLMDWGRGDSGQLGNGATTATNSSPAVLTAVGHGVAALVSSETADQAFLIAQPYVGLSTTKVNYTAASAGTTSASQPVTVTNTGIAPLVIGGVDIVGSDGDEFTKAGDACAGQTIAPGASCSINIRYKPVITHSGTSLATLRIASNAPTKVDTVVLDPPPPAGEAGAPPATSDTRSASLRPATCIATRAGRRAAHVSCVLQGSGPWKLSARLTRRGRTVARRALTTSKALVRFTLRSRHALHAGQYTLTAAIRTPHTATALTTERVALR